MAAGRRTLLLALVLLLFAKAKSNTYTICNNTGITNDIYTRRPGSNYCYLLFQTNTDFSLANRTCVRQNGYLVKIESEEENNYITSTYSTPNGNLEFWIGLTDQDAEGAFRWVKDNTLVSDNSTYSNWFEGSASATNTDNFDCVKFTVNGWSVQQTFCDSSRLPYLCRQGVCGSEDGLTCYKPPVVTSSSISPVIIAIIVIIVVMLIIVVIVTVFLVWLWKYQNDAFYRYILCCVYGGSKTHINNLKQENIRLRKELSQQKLNLNSSGRFQGQLTHQNSQTGMTSPNPSAPLSADPYGRIPPNRSFSFSSNKVSPPGVMSPQTSNSFLPPPRMGRSFSNTSGISLGSSVKAPFNTRPILPTIKSKISPISEEVFPTGDDTKPSHRPPSAHSDSSVSSSSTSASDTNEKKTKDKPSDATSENKEDTKETAAEDSKEEPSSKET